MDFPVSFFFLIPHCALETTIRSSCSTKWSDLFPLVYDLQLIHA